MECSRQGCHREATVGYKTCERCREGTRLAQRRSRSAAPAAGPGICGQCRRAPVDGLYKTCADCRGKQREYTQQWRQKYPEKEAARSARAKERYRSDPAYRARVNDANARYAEKNRPKARHARLKYRLPDLTGFDFDRMWREQDGLCAICGSALRKEGRSGVNVDHCHDTGRVRELLCQPCNNGLGCFKDDPSRLRKAISYLMKHRRGVEIT